MISLQRYKWANLLWRKLLLLLVALLFTVSTSAYAESSIEQSGDLQVRLGTTVIYCAAQLKGSDDLFLHALKDGLPVATVWQVEIDGVRDYWVDESIAEITVVRRVVPDLLSRSWLLKDEASGISQRTYAVSEAIRFLATLDRFPVIDRSLLTAKVLYIMRASAESHVGEMDSGWWGGLLESDETLLEQEFSIP